MTGQREWTPSRSTGTKQVDHFLLTIQYSVAILVGERSEAVAGKQKRHQAERQNRRLPDEPEIRRRRASLLHVDGNIT